VLAVDKDGREHVSVGSDSSGTDAFTQLSTKFPGLPIEQVKEFHFQVRPYQWGEFPNVMLRPKFGMTSSRAETYRTALVIKGALRQVVTVSGTLNPALDDPTKWHINAPVAEADIGLVEGGQMVEFTLDAFPSRTFSGQVVQVGNTPVTVQNVVCYDTLINVADAEPKFKPGMTANARIIVAQRDDVLKIPNLTLRFRPPGSAANAGLAPAPSERVVYVVRGGDNDQAEPVRIRIGISDGSITEVTDGLKEGDRVVTGWVSPPNNNSAAEADRP
jgi:hypothetical protein